MAAGTYNFTIEQGSTLTRVFRYKNADGTPKSLANVDDIRMQIRETIGSANPVTGGTFGLDSGFTRSVPAGTSTTSSFTLSIPSATTAAYNFTNAVYDIELVNDGITTRLLQGKIKLSKEVTRD